MMRRVFKRMSSNAAASKMLSGLLLAHTSATFLVSSGSHMIVLMIWKRGVIPVLPAIRLMASAPRCEMAAANFPQICRAGRVQAPSGGSLTMHQYHHRYFLNKISS